MSVWNFIFVLFFFITHKQLYASSHFTGASKSMPTILLFSSLANILALILYLIYITIIRSFLIALILLLISFVVLLLLNRFIASSILNYVARNNDLNNLNTRLYYESRCDVASTVIAVIGLLFNLITVLCFLFIVIF